MREILFLVLITLNTAAYSTNYYVSNKGSDSSDGLTPSTAWKTVNKVNSRTYKPGDSILFERGGIWNENLKITSSGSPAGQITYSAYGEGNKPKFNGIAEISGWTNSRNWTQVKTNVWRIDLGSSSTNAVQVWLNNHPANRSMGKNVDDVTASNPWEKWGGLFYLYSTSNPASAFSSIKQSSSSGFMRTYSKDYITISNIEVTGWLSTILDGCSHWIIEHCDWGWGNGEHGIRIRRDGSKHALNGIIRHCTFDSGDRNPVTQSSPRWGSNTKQGLGLIEGASNWLIHDNYFRAWGHVHLRITSINGHPSQGNKVYNNYFTNKDGSYGRSATIDTHINTLSLMNPNNPNEFFSNYTFEQSVQSQMLGAYTKIYNNVWNRVKGRGNLSTNSANAISLDGYSSRTGYRQKIYNNVFAYCGQAGIFYPGYDSHEDQTENEVINNIFYKNGRGEDHRVDNQLYIGFFTPITVIDNQFRNNIFYTDRDADKAINIYKRYIDVAAFNSVSSGSTNPQNHVTSGNLAVDPLFVDPENGDFRLMKNSPAIGAGLTPLSGKDMAGNEWGDKPGIGPFTIVNSKSPVNYYTLSLENEGKGIVLSNGKEEYSKAVESDSTITIEAIPDSGWTFSNWAGDLSGFVNPIEIKMNEDKNIKAIFIEETYTLTIICEGEGEVRIFPAQESYVSGTMINLEALAEEQWEFHEWEGDLISADIQTSFVIEQNMRIKARFNSLTTNSNFISEGQKNIQIYPNPAKGFFSISAEESTVKPDGFNIIDLSGRIVYQGILISNISDIQIPNFLNSGIYIIELISKKIPFYTQRLVITK